MSAGLQAVLELYFVRFLYVCSGEERATSLSTTSVNVYIAIYQLSAISAGFLADKIFGRQKKKKKIHGTLSTVEPQYNELAVQI